MKHPAPWNVMQLDCGEWMVIDTAGTFMAGPYEEEATARLIAAAPELLTACLAAHPQQVITLQRRRTNDAPALACYTAATAELHRLEAIVDAALAKTQCQEVTS